MRSAPAREKYAPDLAPKQDSPPMNFVCPVPEEQLLNALARLHDADASPLGPDTRLVGLFRAQDTVVPVWDLHLGMGAAATEEPDTPLGQRLEKALDITEPLTNSERRARAGLTTRRTGAY